MKINCPRCGVALSVPESAVACTLRCPRCKQAFALQGGQTAPAGRAAGPNPAGAVEGYGHPARPADFAARSLAGDLEAPPRRWSWLGLWWVFYVAGMVLGLAMNPPEAKKPRVSVLAAGEPASQGVIVYRVPSAELLPARPIVIGGPEQVPAAPAEPQEDSHATGPAGQSKEKPPTFGEALPGLLMLIGLTMFFLSVRGKPRTVGTAYLLWFMSGLGCLGLHRFYCRRYGSGVVWLFTAGVFLIGGIVDAFTIPRMVDEANGDGMEPITRPSGLAGGTQAKPGVDLTSAAVGGMLGYWLGRKK